MPKIFVVAVASLGLAVALNFGLASAHPFADPTPPATPTPRVDNNTAPAAPATTETDVEQEGDNQDTDMNEVDAEDANESDADEADSDSATTTPATTTTTRTGKHDQGEHAKQDRNTEKDSESEGDD